MKILVRHTIAHVSREHTWLAMGGRTIPIPDLTDQHLINIIKRMEYRQGRLGVMHSKYKILCMEAKCRGIRL